MSAITDITSVLAWAIILTMIAALALRGLIGWVRSRGKGDDVDGTGRENLADMIWQITPTDNPLLDKFKKKHDDDYTGDQL